jgi:hypothetical protein
MDSHLPLQPDGHRGHNHAASEKECLPPIFSQALFEALPSDSFEHEFNRQMNDLPKGDYRRARALFITGGHFNLSLLQKRVSGLTGPCYSLPRAGGRGTMQVA